MRWEGYPIRLSPIYKEKVWGGNQISCLRGKIPSSGIGESWDIVCRDDCECRVENGAFAGKEFREILTEYPEEILGNQQGEKAFPILIKLIGTKEALSVQVHPDDTYAEAMENGVGKTEMWYVLSADSDAYLVAGTRNCTKEQFREAVMKGCPEECLNYMPVKKGDYLLLPSGMVHALGPGCLVAEIQQNSDITYRIWDYGRARNLHLERAMDVLDVEVKPDIHSSSSITAANQRIGICKTEYFQIDYINVDGKFPLPFDERCFHTVTCTAGRGVITYGSGRDEISLGDSLLLPADFSGGCVEGRCSLLFATPNVRPFVYPAGKRCC